MNSTVATTDTPGLGIRGDNRRLHNWYTNKTPHCKSVGFAVAMASEAPCPGVAHLASVGALTQDYFIPLRPGTNDIEVELRQYHDEERIFIIVDFGESLDEFPDEYNEVVQSIRNNGRPILADDLLKLINDMREEPINFNVTLISLRDMAQLLIEERDFKDPSIGPDGNGVMYAQWEIMNGGDLVLGFPGYGEIVLVAQNDEAPNAGGLDISVRGSRQRIIDEYGYLVPRLC